MECLTLFHVKFDYISYTIHFAHFVSKHIFLTLSDFVALNLYLLFELDLFTVLTSNKKEEKWKNPKEKGKC